MIKNGFKNNVGHGDTTCYGFIFYILYIPLNVNIGVVVQVCFVSFIQNNKIM